MALPLLMPRREWERIRGAHESREELHRAEKALYIQNLDQQSKMMTRHWPNSIDNVNQRNEEVRRELARRSEEANERFYAQYVRRERGERARHLARARDRLFIDKDAPKTLLSAVIECATLKERDLQLDFQKQLKKERDENTRVNDNQLIDQAKRWMDEQKSQAHARFLINKEHKQFIHGQIKECSERDRKEKEEELRMEQKDNEKSKQQIKYLKDFENRLKLAERARIKADMEQASADLEQTRREESERELLDEKLRNVYQQYKFRLDCHRKRTETEIQKEKLAQLEKIGMKLETSTAARDALEKKMLDKAIREIDKRNDARLQSDLQKNESIVKDRQEERLLFLEDEKKRRHEEESMRTWEMMNRFKNTELSKAFEQNQREKELQRMFDHRKDLLRQWRERNDREASELAEWRRFHGEYAERRLRETDSKVLRHAQLLRDEARAAGHPTLPLDRTIQMFGRKYGLHPARPLPASQQEHFPGYTPEDRTGLASAVEAVGKLRIENGEGKPSTKL